MHYDFLWSLFKVFYAVEISSSGTSLVASCVFNQCLLLGGPCTFSLPRSIILTQSSFRFPAGFLGWLAERRCDQKPSNTDSHSAHPAWVMTEVEKCYRVTRRESPAQSGRREFSVALFLRLSSFLWPHFPRWHPSARLKSSIHYVKLSDDQNPNGCFREIALI